MSNFLDNIAVRALGATRGIRPRILPMFAEPDVLGNRDIETALEVFDVARDTNQQQPRVDPGTSIDVDFAARDISQQQSREPESTESAERYGFEARHDEAPEKPLNVNRNERTVSGFNVDEVRGSESQAARGDVKDLKARVTPRRATRALPGALNVGEEQRVHRGADFALREISSAEENVVPNRAVATSRPLPFEQANVTEQRHVGPASSASRYADKPHSTRDLDTRGQSAALGSPSEARVQSQIDSVSDPEDTQAPLPDRAPRLPAPEVASDLMETHSSLPAREPGRPALSPMSGSGRTRNLQRMQQATGQATSPTEPEIHITIGRIDVRATVASPAQEKRDKSTSSLQLADYLKRRDGSGAA